MGSDLDQFLKQPFVPAAFGMMCFFGILLIITVALLFYVRQRKAAKERQAAASVPGYATIASEHDMPDLALLVHAPPAPIQEAVPLASLVPPPAPTAPAPVRPARKGTFTIRTQDGAASEAVEVMSVLRDVVDGQLIVQMGDKAYQNIASSPEAKDRFNKIMRELGQIAAQASSTPVQSVESADKSASPEYDEETAPPVVESEPPLPVQKPRPASAPPPVPRSGVMPGDLPSFKLADNPMIKPKRGQKLDLKPVPEINIAGAIEAYLQYKLQNTPGYTGRSIHIYPAPDGGVSIEVDGQYYDAVGDVADTEVREFISTAIQEWQERH